MPTSPARPALIALALLGASTAAAAERYVATNGNDANAGTLASPVRTLRKAYLMAAAGDAIVLRGGTYSETLYIEKADIALRAYNNEAASIVEPYTDPTIGNLVEFAAGGGSVTGIEINGGYDYPLKFDAGPGLAKGCHLHNAGYIGVKIVPHADNITIDGCEIDHCGMAFPANGLGLDDVGGSNLVIRHCNIHDIRGYDALYVKGGAAGTLIEDNYVHDVDGSGITLGDGTDPQFMVSGAWETVNGVVRNNIVTNCNAAGLVAFAALNPTFLNNTCINVARVSRGGVFIVAENGTLTTGMVCENNIIIVTSSRPTVFVTQNSLGSGYVSNNNCFAANATFESDTAGMYAATVAAWRTATGQERATISGDPKVDANDHLLAGSPCIDHGIAASSVTQDYDGQARPSGAGWDIGADEYIATTVAQRGPYGGVARAIPGTIEAEDFDEGGEGVAYHDLDATNDGGGYRATGVDIRAGAATPWQVGWFGAGEWMEYTVKVATSGSYDIDVRVATGSAGGSVRVAFDGVDATGSLAFGTTGGYDTWTDVVKRGVALTAGQHVMRLTCDGGNLDCDRMVVTSSSSVAAGQVYELVCKRSGKVLDVSGVSLADGAAVHQWADWGGPNQRWRMDAQADGSFAMTSINSGKELDASGSSLANGADIIQWANLGGANQHWRIADVGGGYVSVTNVNSGKVLDVDIGPDGLGGYQDGARVQQWTWLGGDNQKWALMPIAPTGVASLDREPSLDDVFAWTRRPVAEERGLAALLR